MKLIFKIKKEKNHKLLFYIDVINGLNFACMTLRLQSIMSTHFLKCCEIKIEFQKGGNKLLISNLWYCPG
ncbi:hypothetical protein BMR05_15140 [Methylococcaceae bacterium HT4]|nr:hypothetical protein BMR10_17095 [Methylococcaceae bacterium CS4]TXK93670.1 hypothetical protein BMR11_16515 [Methylococcaceae bacterium CS5]TXL02425.1 hypothetical protein BMR09_16925 [Methylococcaceae bacterium CS3]TXL02836.1 hypothetical protein BMR07_16835 [Methylococcaceae bacterium CS1]TXL04399.1 hypothetical protein BMR08_16635 [Methylococcaceae bacterium CS2]TXL12523.1 hypothetical protein BMR05_15140 [Methylococcaceae bacterium HT4]TXL17363.1 hypothetical protein BMR06_14950 [Meth